MAAMRLYIRMRSQAHPRDYNSGSGEAQNNYPAWRQRELERMKPRITCTFSFGLLVLVAGLLN